MLIYYFLSFKIKSDKVESKKFKGMIKPKDEIWVYYIDEDADGNIDDETPRFDYKYNLDMFNFNAGVKSRKTLVTMSANIKSDEKKIVINTCDGSHGTHCAGIASGYKIYGKDGYNGIAPGAYVVSIKIGSNVLSGGATTTESMMKAYNYGIEFLKESGIKYGVFSMSYGIGSETPGRSEIEKFLNKFVNEHDNVAVVVANGNNGPGINSTGNPAGASDILSIGAMLPVETLKNLYGSQRKKPWVTHFSSRGGETSKPDVVAPGGASSTVPAFEGGDAFWGTSMACPQAAGAVAVLMSAAIQSNFKFNGSIINKAVKYSAQRLEGYSNVDQGNGLVNIPKAYDYMKILSERDELNKSVTYSFETTNTYYPDKKGNVSFWKSGGFIPSKNFKQNVSVKVNYPEKFSKDQIHNFYRAFTLSTNEEWLRTDKDEIYVRGELGANFAYFIDDSYLKKPGLYSAKIYGKTKGENNGGFNDFDIQATVVIPYKFESSNDYKLVLKNQELKIGDIERIFVDVPLGAQSMNIKITPVENKNFGMTCYLFKPDGDMHSQKNSNDPNFSKDFSFNVAGKSLERGIWEIIPYSFFQNATSSFYNIEVSFYVGETVKSLTNRFEIPLGSNPYSKIKFISYNGEIIKPQFTGSLKGYRKTENITSSGKSIYSRKFKLAQDISAIKFSIKMDNDNFNKFTDIAFNIYDKNGKSLVGGGISRKTDEYTFIPPEAGEYTMEINGGFTSKNSLESDWNFELTESYLFKSPVKLTPENNFNQIIPGTWYESKINAESPLSVQPNGFIIFGDYQIINELNKNVVIYQDIELEN